MASSKHTILLIAGNERSPSLQKDFKDAGYEILTAPNDSAALEAVQQRAPSLVVADRQVSNIQKLRMQKALLGVPIISLGPADIKCSEDECIDDFNHGADLVLCNQTAKQLIAWVRAILRRKEIEQKPANRLLVAGIQMDLDRHEVRVDGKLVELTPKEFQILRYFLEWPNRAFCRQDILNRVWGESYALEEHALDVHIHSLRRKIEDSLVKPKLIVTVRGVGYKLRAASESA